MLIDFQLSNYLSEQRARVDRELERIKPSSPVPEILHRSMWYSLMAGGKRLRPILCLASCTATGGNPEGAMPTAIALEMLHTATLIHDDLPAMDNDDFRRGKPTNHTVFGEDMAILAGDALMTYSLEYVITNTDAPAEQRLRVVHMLLHAIGVHGAMGGQSDDLSSSSRGDINLTALEAMHTKKTGALLVASVVTGAILAGADENIIGCLSRYGERIGLAFQIIDDILDSTSTLDELGKTPHKDEKLEKATFTRLLGEDAARLQAEALIESAKHELAALGAPARPLIAIADYILLRTH